jgi:photosystem II stability/assembly factor-like uncharacterized protein
LHAAAWGGALALLPRGTYALTDAASAQRALAFDGDALIVAGAQVWRHDPSGGSTERLSTPRARIQALAAHPERSGRLLAASEGGGVLRSDDGGRFWRAASDGLPQAQVTALAMAAGAPDTVYAAIAGDGLWRSEDAGKTWSFVMDRPWIHEAERDVLALASVNLASGMGGIWIYAGTEAGLTRVPDCFCRWQDVVAGDAMDALASGAASQPTAPLPPGAAVQALVCAPTAPERLHAALGSGIWASRDGGVVWAQQTADLATALAVHPTDPDHIVAANPGGLSQSRDGGATWTTLATF